MPQPKLTAEDMHAIRTMPARKTQEDYAAERDYVSRCDNCRRLEVELAAVVKREKELLAIIKGGE